MLDVMLCGASDTQQVREAFRNVIEDFGGSPLHYLSGDILYLNSATSTWADNSRATVNTADLCIFVIVRELGTLTWQTEFIEVVTSGKPFLILCRDETYLRYLNLVQGSTPTNLPSGADALLVNTLGMIEREHNATIVQYPTEGFREVLRRQLGNLLKLGLNLVELRNRREFLLTMIVDPDSLSILQLDWATELATDELADKYARKRAIDVLARRSAADEEMVVDLLNSAEQGIQRTAFDRLADLYSTRPPEPEFLDKVVQIANHTGDTGIPRRLVPALFALDIVSALEALKSLDLSDVGVRSRIFEQLEKHEHEILANGSKEPALRLARRCRSGRGPLWQDRLKAFIERNSDSDDEN